MDLCIELEDFKLNIRAGAIIIHDNKLLTVTRIPPMYVFNYDFVCHKYHSFHNRLSIIREYILV